MAACLEPKKTVPAGAPVLCERKIAAVTQPESPSTADRSNEFDRKAALEVLSEAALKARDCSTSATSKTAGTVAIQYEGDGVAHSVVVERPGALCGTEVERCLQDIFLATRVPPFRGTPITVHKSFSFP